MCTLLPSQTTKISVRDIGTIMLSLNQNTTLHKPNISQEPPILLEILYKIKQNMIWKQCCRSPWPRNRKQRSWCPKYVYATPGRANKYHWCGGQQMKNPYNLRVRMHFVRLHHAQNPKYTFGRLSNGNSMRSPFARTDCPTSEYIHISYSFS